jgi:pyruvate/2-oxoglutarate dehydrogenase complex dihydrolipoamide acyltransferase (E2) component
VIRWARAALACAVVATLPGCERNDARAAAEPSRETAPSAPFKWVRTRGAEGAVPEEYPARVLATAGATAVVVPPLAARLLALLVKPGDTVVKGAPIARVIMPDADAAVASTRAAQASLAVLSKRRAQMGLLESDGLVRAADVAALDLEIARATGDRLRADAVLRGAGLGSGGVVTLRSAVAGIVTEVAAIEGELRRPEDGPIARIRSQTGLRVEGAFADALPARATYAFLASDGSSTPMTVVDAAPKAKGLGYSVWFEAQAPLPAVTEGRVAVRLDGTDGLRVVPASAVGASEGSRFVVARAGAESTPARVRVEVVRITSGDALVRGEIPEAALVATDPHGALAQLEREKRP